jgi:hypothetical protein
VILPIIWFHLFNVCWPTIPLPAIFLFPYQRCPGFGHDLQAMVKKAAMEKPQKQGLTAEQ